MKKIQLSGEIPVWHHRSNFLLLKFPFLSLLIFNHYVWIQHCFCCQKRIINSMEGVNLKHWMRTTRIRAKHTIAFMQKKQTDLDDLYINGWRRTSADWGSYFWIFSLILWLRLTVYVKGFIKGRLQFTCCLLWPEFSHDSAAFRSNFLSRKFSDLFSRNYCAWQTSFFLHHLLYILSTKCFLGNKKKQKTETLASRGQVFF